MSPEYFFTWRDATPAPLHREGRTQAFLPIWATSLPDVFCQCLPVTEEEAGPERQWKLPLPVSDPTCAHRQYW